MRIYWPQEERKTIYAAPDHAAHKNVCRTYDAAQSTTTLGRCTNSRVPLGYTRGEKLNSAGQHWQSAGARQPREQPQPWSTPGHHLIPTLAYQLSLHKKRATCPVALPAFCSQSGLPAYRRLCAHTARGGCGQERTKNKLPSSRQKKRTIGTGEE